MYSAMGLLIFNSLRIGVPKQAVRTPTLYTSQHLQRRQQKAAAPCTHRTRRNLVSNEMLLDTVQTRYFRNTMAGAFGVLRSSISC